MTRDKVGRKRDDSIWRNLEKQGRKADGATAQAGAHTPSQGGHKQPGPQTDMIFAPEKSQHIINISRYMKRSHDLP